MGNVKWHACFVALLWNVLKADWSMLICVKRGNQLVEVVSIMWIKFKWEPSGAEMPEEFFFFLWNERWWGWTQCSSNHNTFTNPFLKTAGGKPHMQLSLRYQDHQPPHFFGPFWTVMPASNKVWGGVVWWKPPYYPNNDDQTQETAIWLTERGKEDVGMLSEKPTN